MGKVTIREWYRRVNDTWLEAGFGDAGIPRPTPEEAIAGARKLYRWAFGVAFDGEVKLTSGNRYTWIRRGVMAVNPNSWDGERGIVHLLSHYAHDKLNRHARPHSAAHARVEIAMIRQVIKRGWLGEPPAQKTADKLLALCPVSLMDAACELDIPYKSIRGHALGLMGKGKARMFRGRLVKVQ